MRYTELDQETLERAEREAMVRPSNSAMWDDRLYSTHAPVMSWCERGDDILEESNYHVALDMLNGAAGDQASEHIIDASISHWLVGSLRQIFVQCRNDDRSFTDAWKEAVSIAYAIQDYPILDESDYSEREQERINDSWSDYLWLDVRRELMTRYGWDSDEWEFDEWTELAEMWWEVYDQEICEYPRVEGNDVVWPEYDHAIDLFFDRICRAMCPTANSAQLPLSA